MVTSPSDESRELLQEHLTHIANNKDRMQHTRLRSVGLPFGSGVTESTVKSVVNMRTKRRDRRWMYPRNAGLFGAARAVEGDRLARF